MKKLLLGLGAVTAVAAPVVAVVACSDDSKSPQEQASAFTNKVLKTLEDMKGNATFGTLATSVLSEVKAGIATNGIVTGKATGDLHKAPTSNNYFDHTKTLVRVLDNEDKKLSFSFNMSIAKTKTILGGVDLDVATNFIVELNGKLVSTFNSTANSGIYKSTQRINGVPTADQVGTPTNKNNGPDDYFRFTFSIDKDDISTKTKITKTSTNTVASYSSLFATK